MRHKLCYMDDIFISTTDKPHIRNGGFEYLERHCTLFVMRFHCRPLLCEWASQAVFLMTVKLVNWHIRLTSCVEPKLTLTKWWSFTKADAYRALLLYILNSRCYTAISYVGLCNYMKLYMSTNVTDQRRCKICVVSSSLGLQHGSTLSQQFYSCVTTDSWIHHPKLLLAHACLSHRGLILFDGCKLCRRLLQDCETVFITVSLPC